MVDVTDLTVTVVGCSGTIPGPDSAASCYLIRFDDFALVLDLGSGSLGPLQRYIGLHEVDAVLVSHLHPDHSADLGPYYVARRYSPGAPSSRLPIYGPAQTVDHLARGYPGNRPVAEFLELFELFPLATGAVQIGPLAVTCVRTEHPVECWASRIEVAGRSLVYTADTGSSTAVTALARGAHLLLAEASFTSDGERPPGLHLRASEAGEMARSARVGKLIVTHIPPWNDPAQALAEAAEAFGGPTELAQPGLTFHV